MGKPSFHIINFGCRATQADGAAIAEELSSHQLEQASSWANSDLIIINTCTVTQSADADARQMIRRVHRQNPKARILVTGCYAQRAPETLAQIEGVSCVAGNSHKDRLVALALAGASQPPHSEAGGAPIHCSDIFEARRLEAAVDAGGNNKTRPVLKIQDGCNQRCSYCIVPFVRGNSRSLPAAQVLRQISHLAGQGYKEIVLTGIHLGAYGRDLRPPTNLAELLQEILSTQALQRLRLSSIEPLEVTGGIIELVSHRPQMAKHFHIPLQHGSDRVLELMRRPYRQKNYAAVVEKIRGNMPDAAIGADVMVGFPTETDEDFAQTLDFLEQMPLTYLHVFPFSRRPGTPAAEMRPQVAEPVLRRRGQLLRELSSRKNRAFRSGFLGGTLSVLTLEKRLRAQAIEALSSNFLKVEVRGTGVEPNQMLEVEVTEVTPDGLKGQVRG